MLLLITLLSFAATNLFALVPRPDIETQITQLTNQTITTITPLEPDIVAYIKKGFKLKLIITVIVDLIKIFEVNGNIRFVVSVWRRLVALYIGEISDFAFTSLKKVAQHLLSHYIPAVENVLRLYRNDYLIRTYVLRLKYAQQAYDRRSQKEVNAFLLAEDQVYEIVYAQMIALSDRAKGMKKAGQCDLREISQQLNDAVQKGKQKVLSVLAEHNVLIVAPLGVLHTTLGRITSSIVHRVQELNDVQCTNAH